jgi:hypothetical protein
MMFHNNNPGKFSMQAAGIFLAGLLLLFSSWVQAAQISVKTDRSPVTVDETFQLIFSVDGEPDGKPDFSALEQDFEVLGSSQSRNVSIINGRTSRTTRYLVTVLPRRSGELTVPSVSFGKDLSPVLKLRVQDVAAAQKPSTEATANAVFLDVSADESKPRVQQQVILTVRIFSRIQWREASLSDPQFRGGDVVVQKLGDDRSYEAQRDGETWQVIERRYALFPQKSGELRMDPLSLNLRLPAGRKKQRSPFGSFNDPFFEDFFSSRSYRNKVVRSKSLALDVQPVPAGFSGKRWLVAKKLRLEESWSDTPENLETGEPVTRTLTIVADGVTVGQLPDLELPRIQGLRIYPDDPVNKEQATEDGIRSTSSRKFAIIPTHPGNYQLPAVELKWWNSKTDQEETARIASRLLKVTGAVQPLPNGAGSNPVMATPNLVEQDMPEPAAGLAPSVSPVQVPERVSINTWLMLSSAVFLVLWLLTLVLLLRNRKKPAVVFLPENNPESVPDMGKAWRHLNQAVQSGDALAVRGALLELAPGLWPEQTPRSLEAMAERVEQPLSTELLNLSRYLYAGSNTDWDGKQIETGMRRVAKNGIWQKKNARKSALKPLYPDDGYHPV